MTAMTTPSQIWNSMPGWGIVADLTPPELLAARQLRVLRRFILAALVGLMLIFLALYTVARFNNASARSALSSEQDITTSLTQSESRYSDVTQIQTSIEGTDARLAQVLGSDVDMQPTLQNLRRAMPASLDIKNLSLSTSSTTGAKVFSGLDTSGHPIIGTVTIAGDATTFQGISNYVDALARIPGVVNVVPTSAQGNKLTISYNITLNLTDELYSHRFDNVRKAGN